MNCPNCTQPLITKNGWIFGYGIGEIPVCTNRECRWKMPGTLAHLSYSSISTYVRCGESWRRRYVMQQPETYGPQLIFGGAFHETVEEYFKLNREKDASSIWSQVWKKSVESDNGKTDWGNALPGDYHALGKSMLESESVRSGIDAIQPQRLNSVPVLERRIELEVKGVPIPVVGYIDIITNDNVPGDFKTSSRRWGKNKASEETQPLFYLAALDQLGEKNHKYRFRHYVVTKTANPDWSVHESQHSKSSTQWILDQIAQVWQGIKSEVYIPNSDHFLCSDKWCAFWANCKGK